MCDIEEDIYSCVPVFGLDIAGGDDAGLLLRFVVGSFCGPAGVSKYFIGWETIITWPAVGL